MGRGSVASRGPLGPTARFLFRLTSLEVRLVEAWSATTCPDFSGESIPTSTWSSQACAWFNSPITGGASAVSSPNMKFTVDGDQIPASLPEGIADGILGPDGFDVLPVCNTLDPPVGCPGDPFAGTFTISSELEPPAPNTCEDLATAANDEPLVNEQLPAECVKQAKYVALGDSYSSGEGLAEDAGLNGPGGLPYAGDSTSNSDYPNCHRHFNSYPSVFAHDYLDPSGQGIKAADFAFYACSGAHIQDIYNSPSERNDNKKAMVGPQAEHPDIGSGTDLVSLTIGGNSADAVN